MKTVSEILGIEEPLDLDEEGKIKTEQKEAPDGTVVTEEKTSVEYTVGEEVVSTEIIKKTEEKEIEPVNINHDLVRIEDSNSDIDVVIREGLKAVRETFAFSTDLEPRSKSRALEVAGMLMKETTRAIKHKQDFGLDMIKTKIETAKMSGTEKVGSTQVNNIYTDRETLLKMMNKDDSEEVIDSDSSE